MDTSVLSRPWLAPLLEDLSIAGPRIDLHSENLAPLPGRRRWRSISVKVGKAIDLQAQLDDVAEATVVVCREIFSSVLDASDLIFIKGLLAEGGAVVVVERTADRFQEYVAVWRQLFDAPPVTSDNIQRVLVSAGFSLRSVQVREEPWPFKCMSDDYKQGAREYLLSLPPDMQAALSLPAKDGVIGSLTCLIAEARDDSRHLVPAVASALLRRRLHGECSLLIQRRHRELEFWDHWELPQGHLRHNETFLDAACRELLEETSITGRPCARQPFLSSVRGTQATLQEGFYLTMSGSYPKEFFSVPILMECGSGSPSSFSNREFKWAPIPELLDLLYHGQIYPLNTFAVRRFIENSGWYDS